MRAPFLMLPFTLALAAPLPSVAQDIPRVLFCKGGCFTVDAKGVRTPAPKGTQILPGHRLETGPGSYVQVKLGADNAFGAGEGARVRLDRNAITLDQGRIRLIGGEVLGKPIAQPIELHTNDGTFTLRNADVEMKTTTGPAAPTLVKLNAGDARMGTTLLTKDVQQFTLGKMIEGTVPVTELAPAPTLTTLSTRTTLSSTPVLTLAPSKLSPIVLGPTLGKTDIIKLPTAISTFSPTKTFAPVPVIPEATKILSTKTAGGITLTEAIKQDAIAVKTGIAPVAPKGTVIYDAKTCCTKFTTTTIRR
jgi:hypothetical protein